MLIFYLMAANAFWAVYDVMRVLQIDAMSGVLRIRKELDFETKQFFNLTILAEDRGMPRLQSQTFVEVEVCNAHILDIELHNDRI